MKVKKTINLILAAIGLAMGVAVVVISIVNANVQGNSLITMLGMATASLGILALNNISG